MKRNRKSVRFEKKLHDCIELNKKLESEGSAIRYTPYQIIETVCFFSIFGKTRYKRWYFPNRIGLIRRLYK